MARFSLEALEEKAGAATSAQAEASSRGRFPLLPPWVKQVKPIQSHNSVSKGRGWELPRPPRHLPRFGTSQFPAPSYSSAYRGSHESGRASRTGVPLGKEARGTETGALSSLYPLIHHCLPLSSAPPQLSQDGAFVTWGLASDLAVHP